MLLKKIFIVLLGVIIFRMGTFIPIPGVDAVLMGEFFKETNGTILDFANAFSGGSLERMSIFSTGIMPYISASIIIYILTFFSSHIKSLQQEGMNGQIKISKYTRWLTLLIASFQALILTLALSDQVVNGSRIIENPDFHFFITAIVSLVAGTMGLIWVGEKITEYGIGNGISLIIYAGIVSGLPSAIGQSAKLLEMGEINNLTALFILVLIVAAVLFVITIEKSKRKVSVEYSKKSFEALYSHKGSLPFKINMAGIMPPIFAASLMTMPMTLSAVSSKLNIEFIKDISQFFQHGSLSYILFYSFLIGLFSYFLTKSKNNPTDISNRLKKQGVFVKGIRPGEPTEKFFNKLIFRIGFIGAAYLIAVCMLPEFLIKHLNVPFYFGGTSLLIIVSIGLEWQKQITSHFKGKEYTSIKKDLLKDFKGQGV